MNNSKTFLNLNLLKQKKFNFNKPGKYIVFFHNLSGELIFNINAKGVDLDIYGLYTGKDQDKFIVKTQQRHVAPSARSNLLIKGVLEILANEVFCTHGSTTGKLNEDQIFFLQSRGLKKTDARKILLKGFLDEIYHKLMDEKIQIIKPKYD